MRSGTVMIAMLLIVAAAALLPLAYADPPDPTWFGGYWDDDDHDDVVLAVVRTVASTDRPAVFEPPAELLPVSVSLPVVPRIVIASADDPDQPRAPPQA